jgi:hypothetical protein
MTLSLLHVVCIVLAALAAWFGGKWLFRADTAVEGRRRQAAHLSAKLAEMGLKSLSELFMDYAVGDYSGMSYKMAQVVEKLRGNDKDVLEDMSDVFDRLLKLKLACKEGRALVKSELESVERMLAPEMPAPVAPAPVAPAPVAPAPVAPAPVAPAPPVEPVAAP